MAEEAAVAEALGAVETPESVIEAEPVEGEATVAGAPFDWSTLGEGVDEDVARTAIETYRSLDTEEGATDFFVRAGMALGLSADTMVALFDAAGEGEQTPEEEAAAKVEADRPLTRAEAEQLIKDMALAPIAAQQQGQQVAVIQGVIQAQQAALSIPDSSLNIVLGMADQYLTDETRLVPAKVEAAIGKAHNEYAELVKVEAQRYLTGKAATAEGLPRPVTGGGSAGGDEPSEPQSVAEASARVREALRRGGNL